MFARTSASRYAKALFDVGREQSDLAAIERDLSTVVRAIADHPGLGRALTSPGTPPTARLGIVQALAAKVGMQEPSARLLTLLSDRGRLELLADILDVFQERLRAHANIVRATVTSAMALSPEQVRVLDSRLSEATGKHVELDTAVDPTIIGGVIAQIGGTVYDGSIRTQLEKMRRRLMERV